MASTYTSSLLIEQMATGDQTGTWGATTNTNFTLFEQAIAGYLSVAQGDVANLTLTDLNGALDQARNAVINLTGALTADRNVVVPTQTKLYLIRNSTTGGFNVVVKTAAGTGVTIPPGYVWWVYCDGTNIVTGLPGPWTYTSGAAPIVTAAAVIRAANGTAAAPTFSFANGSSNGMFAADTDTPAFAVAGTMRAYLKSTGLFVTPSLSATVFGTDPYTQLGTGTVQAYVNGSAGFFGRLLSNGATLTFYKGSTEVGSVSVTGTATTYVTSSDGRRKTNFRDFTSGAIIDNLRVGLFDWLPEFGGGTGYGVVAQEAVEVFPNMITPGDDDHPWGADYSALVPVLLRELQDLRRRLAAAGL